MISEEQNPAAKRLKRYKEEQSAICPQISKPEYNSSKNNHSSLSNGHAEMGGNAIEKTSTDTQDILAEACSVIGLGSSMLELVDSPTKIDPTDYLRTNGHYSTSGHPNKRNDANLVNGYRNYPEPYYHDTKTYKETTYGYNNSCKEQRYPWNPNPSRKYYHPSASEKSQPHHSYPYPKNQYEWHALCNNQSQNPTFRSKPFMNKPGVQTQHCYRLSYHHGQNGVSQNNVQPTYPGISDDKRYAQPYVNSYQITNPGQVNPSMNSCRYSSPNNSMPSNTYPIPNNFPQQGMHFQPNRHYTYGNGQSPQQQFHEVAGSNKVSGFENCSKVDPSTHAPVAYSPIRSPITPAPRIIQQNGAAFEKCDHFPNPQLDRSLYCPISNKYITSDPKNEYRKSIPNEYYQPSPYKEDNNNYSHVRQSMRRHSYSNGYDINGGTKTCYNLASDTPKPFYPANYTQQGYLNLENNCNYNTHNGLKQPNSVDNIRSNGLTSCNGYNNYKDANRIPYQSMPMPKTAPIDYSIYGTDEINKNSVKDQTPNLPNSPNIELIPLEGTSIISTLSELPQKSVPEISLNSIRPTKEMESSHFKNNYPCNMASNVSCNGLHTLNKVDGHIMNNGNGCSNGQQEGKTSPNWCAKESPKYLDIPELTSIADVERLPQLTYSPLTSNSCFDLEPPLAADPVMAGSHLVSSPLKIHKILNRNFVGAHSKYRPASEPLFQQKWPLSDESKRPLSVPNNNIDINFDSSLNIPTEDSVKINKFQQKLSPVLEHLLSIPEASGLLSLKESPKELLKHLVKLWGGETALSSSKIPLINIKENFLKLVKLLFKAAHLLEWGWQNATADRILDDLVAPADGGMEYQVSLKVLGFISPPVQDSSNDDYDAFPVSESDSLFT